MCAGILNPFNNAPMPHVLGRLSFDLFLQIMKDSAPKMAVTAHQPWPSNAITEQILVLETVIPGSKNPETK